MKKSGNLKHSQKGFTLIELSIVLVIIGLIVGGVLVGQDLIKAAEIRATIGQLEKYNAAANTFRTKYNGLPGDLSSPANYGMTPTDDAATAGLNGNGMIEGCDASGVKFGCETAAFWNHLSTANLVDGSFSNTTMTASYATGVTFSGSILPTAKLGGGNFIFIGNNGTSNTFRVVGLTSAASSGVITSTNALNPTESYQIDVKLDDGVPTSGIVLAYDAAAIAYTLTQGNGRCAQNSAYEIADAPTTPLCNLSVATSF